MIIPELKPIMGKMGPSYSGRVPGPAGDSGKRDFWRRAGSAPLTYNMDGLRSAALDGSRKPNGIVCRRMFDEIEPCTAHRSSLHLISGNRGAFLSIQLWKRYPSSGRMKGRK
jgi:hypothetical protein